MSEEKQMIEDLTEIFDEEYEKRRLITPQNTAEKLTAKGYHRQSVGEWETIPDYQPDRLISYRHICSVCKTTYKDIRPHGHKYCHECGARMKGV